MNLLAIDQSTGSNGLTLLTKDNRAITRRWQASRMRSPELFRLLPEALAEAGIEPANIDRFAVGLGPGSFTGIRAAIAAAQAMALPGQVPVDGFSSAEVIAAQVAGSRDASHICVVGDARRKRLWIAQYRIENRRPTRVGIIRLIPAEALPAAILPGTVLVSPDWDRLTEILSKAVPDHADLVRETITPDAEWLARLARDAAASGTPSMPPVPIYLHPAVPATPGIVRQAEVTQ